MKKVLIIYGLLVLGIIIIAVLRFRGVNILPDIGNLGGGNEATVTIGENSFEVEVADEEEEREQGLSGRDNLEEGRGMLFVFEEKGTYGFWMRDVSFPLDIIYISDNTIVDIVNSAEPGGTDTQNLTVYEPGEPANYVLEINGGRTEELGIEIGNEVTFEGL